MSSNGGSGTRLDLGRGLVSWPAHRAASGLPAVSSMLSPREGPRSSRVSLPPLETAPSIDKLPRNGFVYDWIEGLRNTKEVLGRDMVFRNHPYGVVVFSDAKLYRGHLNFNHANVRGALLDFPGIEESNGKTPFVDGLFDFSDISLWNVKFSGDFKM